SARRALYKSPSSVRFIPRLIRRVAAFVRALPEPTGRTSAGENWRMPRAFFCDDVCASPVLPRAGSTRRTGRMRGNVSRKLGVHLRHWADERLQERWIAGDCAAAEALFGRYHTQLSTYFRHKSPDAADDLVQQTMLAALEGHHRLRGDLVFKAYLFGT